MHPIPIEMSEITVSLHEFPFHIRKLESKDGQLVWMREMQHYLIACNMFQWTEFEDSNLGDQRTLSDEAWEVKQRDHNRGHEWTTNCLQSRLGDILFSDLEHIDNTYTRWQYISIELRVRDIVTFNGLYL